LRYSRSGIRSGTFGPARQTKARPPAHAVRTAAAMDATMAGPSPEQSWDVRLLSRWNGWMIGNAQR
jgi:hypothetical protein